MGNYLGILGKFLGILWDFFGEFFGLQAPGGGAASQGFQGKRNCWEKLGFYFSL